MYVLHFLLYIRVCAGLRGCSWDFFPKTLSYRKKKKTYSRVGVFFFFFCIEIAITFLYGNFSEEKKNLLTALRYIFPFKLSDCNKFQFQLFKRRSLRFV